MKILLQSLALVLLALLVSCASAPESKKTSHPLESKIVGRWKEAGANDIGTFHQNQTVELSSSMGQVFGAYEFLGPHRLQIELLNAGAKLRPHVYEIDIVDDRMTWKDRDGKITEFHRVR